MSEIGAAEEAVEKIAAEDPNPRKDREIRLKQHLI